MFKYPQGFLILLEKIRFEYMFIQFIIRSLDVRSTSLQEVIVDQLKAICVLCYLDEYHFKNHK